MIKLLNGDALALLKTLKPETINTCITSPPYWGLRDYGVKGQLGLEKSPQEYVANLVEIFREVRRVLRDDGTLWLNLGDSYANDGKWGGHTGGKHVKALHCSPIGRNKRYTGLKPKDLMGIPWRVAFALQQDGWYLRQDIIWAKPNPMPESVTDRCTKAHEYIFLLSKSERYFYDADAIAEPASPNTHSRIKMPDGWDTGKGGHGSYHRNGREKGETHTRAPGVTPKSAPEDSNIRAKGSFHASTTSVLETRNKRSVWTVSTKPFKESHFATFPPDLIEPCIKAGCPEQGIILDPFAGSGTVGMVANKLNRHAILFELNPEYIEIAKRRCGLALMAALT